jgi:hypothetical protein
MFVYVSDIHFKMTDILAERLDERICNIRWYPFTLNDFIKLHTIVGESTAH